MSAGTVLASPRRGYRSLFEDLPPLRVDPGALRALGRPGGPCDLGTDPEPTAGRPDLSPVAM